MNHTGVPILENIDEQSQLLIAAFQASISGIIITNYQQEENPFIYCNKAFEEMTGYMQEKILARIAASLKPKTASKLAGTNYMKLSLKERTVMLCWLITGRTARSFIMNFI